MEEKYSDVVITNLVLSGTELSMGEVSLVSLAIGSETGDV